MRLLDAVNLVMPKLGERPVTTLEMRHPTLAVLLPIIEQTRRSVLLRGWWFNDYPYTAPLDNEGLITLGTETLSFVPDCSDVAAMRGLKLFNTQTLDYVFTEPVKGRVTQDVPFDELPESAATHVFYSACVEAYATDLGVTAELQVWQALAGAAWSELLGEHLRQRKHSTRRSRRWRQYISAMQG